MVKIESLQNKVITNQLPYSHSPFAKSTNYTIKTYRMDKVQMRT